jgi:streptogramin lyase
MTRFGLTKFRAFAGVAGFAILVAFAGANSACSTEIIQLTASPEVIKVHGYFREYALDNLRSGPAIVAVDRDDDVWVAMARSGKLMRLRNEQLRGYEIGQDSRPVALALGTAENGHPNEIWISAAFDEKLVRFDRQTEAVTKYAIGGGGNFWPFMIGLGPNGEVWFSERAAGQIGRLDPDSGKIDHFKLHSTEAGPAGLVVAPRDGTVWFTEGQTDRVGRLDSKTGIVTDYVMGEQATGMTSGPAGIALDGNGHVWFTKLEGKLGTIDPQRDAIELIDLPPEARRPAGIAVAPNGDVWCLALDGNMAVRYEPADHRFTLYPLPTGSADEEPDVPPSARTSRPFGIAFDRSGNLWFSEQYTGQLGVLVLAPPSISIVSPRDEVQQHDPFVTVRALDRAGGISSLHYALDDRPIDLNASRLSLLDAEPGTHRLSVTATNAAGLSATDSAMFEFVPGAPAIEALLNQLKPISEPGLELHSRMQSRLQHAPKNVDRSAEMVAILEELQSHDDEFPNFPHAYAQTLITYFRKTPLEIFEVKVLDEPPYFSQATLRIRAGETVTWRYDPPSRGHVMPQYPNRLEIPGEGVVSPMLRAGESFAHRFTNVGKFAVLNRDRPEASLIVEVVE